MNISPLKAIRLKCLDCSDMSSNEVRLCEFTECPIYFYRFGKNPNLKGKRVNNLPDRQNTKNITHQ